MTQDDGYRWVDGDDGEQPIPEGHRRVRVQLTRAHTCLVCGGYFAVVMPEDVTEAYIPEYDPESIEALDFMAEYGMALEQKLNDIERVFYAHMAEAHGAVL